MLVAVNLEMMFMEQLIDRLSKSKSFFFSFNFIRGEVLPLCAFNVSTLSIKSEASFASPLSTTASSHSAGLMKTVVACLWVFNESLTEQ